MGGPFPEIHSPVFVFPVSALIEYKGFDGACVTVEVSGFRVSDGPSLIFEITQVKDFPLDDSPNGVSAVVGAADVVPFLTDELKVARRVDLTGLGRFEQIEEASPGKGLHGRITAVHPGRFEKGRSKVGEADVIVDFPPVS